MSGTTKSSSNGGRHLERYIRKLEGDKFRGNFVIEGYLGQLDWLGDDYEEVSAGRYFAFSVRFQRPAMICWSRSLPPVRF